MREGVERLDTALDHLMAIDATAAHDQVVRIATVRAGSARYAFILELASVSLALAAGFVAMRSLRRQREVELVHEELLEARAGELEDLREPRRA